MPTVGDIRIAPGSGELTFSAQSGGTTLTGPADSTSGPFTFSVQSPSTGATIYDFFSQTGNNVMLSLRNLVAGPNILIGADGGLITISSTASGNAASLPIITVTYSDAAQSGNDDIVGNGDAFEPGNADVLYTVVSDTTVTATGAIIFYGGNAVTTAGVAASGDQGIRFNSGGDGDAFVTMVYATNSAGTSYSAPASGHTRVICLAAGTSISLSDGTYKLIEDITYDDDLLVWDFDHGLFAESKPLWIKKASTARSFNLLTFSDGTTLRTVGQHRIFNKEDGAFTYPLTDATPVGTTTYNQYGNEITLTAKEIVNETVISYNVLTDYHMNLFANGVLTSNRFNNLYPIVDMKFVRDHEASADAFAGIPDKFYHGMRLSEQKFEVAHIRQYVERMLAHEVELA